MIDELLMNIASRVYAFDPTQFSAGGFGGTSYLEGGGGTINISGTLDNVLTVVLIIAGGLAFLALLIGSAQYLLAGGDPTKAEAGKKTLTWAIVGIVLVILFYLILTYAIGGVFKGVYK